MLLAASVKVGGVNRAPPGPASICPMFRPELKPDKNAAFEAVVAVCALPGSPGASCRPDAMKVFFNGEFVSNAVAICKIQLTHTFKTRQELLRFEVPGSSPRDCLDL
jgi:hypothetical protein